MLPAPVSLPWYPVRTFLAPVRLPLSPVKLLSGPVKLPLGPVKLPLAQVSLPQAPVKLRLGPVRLPLGPVSLPLARVNLPLARVSLPWAPVSLPLAPAKPLGLANLSWGLDLLLDLANLLQLALGPAKQQHPPLCLPPCLGRHLVSPHYLGPAQCLLQAWVCYCRS